MLNLDPSKLLVIAVVAIIVLGPERLPQFARQVGAAWRSFSEFRQRMDVEVRRSLPELSSSTDLATFARSPAALLDHLSAPAGAPDPTAEDRVEDDAESMRQRGDLPRIAAADAPHWAASVPDEAACVGQVDADAEKVWLEAQTPFVGDATLN
jgi:Sec-independent protein translocase protein TatA